MEFLLLLPVLLFGGLFVGGSGGSGDGDEVAQERDEDDADAPLDGPGETENGAPQGDEIAGTALNDILLGGSASDTIEGLGGNDVIAGEAGNDSLTGDAGSDIVLGGAGNDLVDGADGNDILIGGAGNDRVIGGAGNDFLIGSSGSDTLLGGTGNDVLIGLDYDRLNDDLPEAASLVRETVSRAYGDDVPDAVLARIGAGVMSGDVAERGADLLEGGAGRDVLVGDDGDTMTGGAGADEFNVAFEGGAATSILTDFDHRSESLTLLLDNPDTATIVIRADGPDDSVLLVDDLPAVRLIGQTVAELSANPAAWLFVERA